MNRQKICIVYPIWFGKYMPLIYMNSYIPFLITGPQTTDLKVIWEEGTIVLNELEMKMADLGIT